MSWLELLILAVSLSFDTFAVSIGGGTALPDLKSSGRLKIMTFFALFQSVFLFAGWYIGGKFTHIITDWDHWVAFVILLYIGGKMFLGAFKDGDCEQEKQEAEGMLQNKKLVILSVATSIDAVAVGVSLAFINLATDRMFGAAVMTALVTAAAAYAGLVGGRKLGCYIGKRAEMIGGLILIAIGGKILIEHLF